MSLVCKLILGYRFKVSNFVLAKMLSIVQKISAAPYDTSFLFYKTLGQSHILEFAQQWHFSSPSSEGHKNETTVIPETSQRITFLYHSLCIKSRKDKHLLEWWQNTSSFLTQILVVLFTLPEKCPILLSETSDKCFINPSHTCSPTMSQHYKVKVERNPFNFPLISPWLLAFYDVWFYLSHRWTFSLISSWFKDCGW